MSYEKMIKWNKKRPKGTRQCVIMHTESGFTPSKSFMDKYFAYRGRCEAKGVVPAECSEYYNNQHKYNDQLQTA